MRPYQLAKQTTNTHNTPTLDAPGEPAAVPRLVNAKQTNNPTTTTHQRDCRREAMIKQTKETHYAQHTPPHRELLNSPRRHVMLASTIQ
jgi:hypothetical protein